METLTTITTARICELIATAERRVVYAAPGIFLDTAHAIQDFFLRQSQTSLDEQNCFEIIVDPDPEVCRLGYGKFEALKLLTETLGARIRKAEGLRIGVLIVGDAAWIYSPHRKSSKPSLRRLSQMPSRSAPPRPNASSPHSPRRCETRQAQTRPLETA